MPATVTPDRLRRIAEVYEAVLELEEELRGPYLAALARADLDLVRYVHRLLDERAEETEAATPKSSGQESFDAEDQPATDDERRIGPYRLVELLGVGGMGAVHLAERSDSEFERRVAIKVIRLGSDVPEVRRRFLSERQILASFDHPNIAKMHEGGTTEDGSPYLVMEYVKGMPIDRYCDEHRLTVKERLALFRQVCSAVEYAHQNLVVHRDLKPSNVLVTADGVPKLLDFGIAKLLDPEHFPMTVEVTEAGQGPLTPNYASPEQIAAERVTTLSDVYSLGILLYRLLTGRLPFDRVVRSRAMLAREAAVEVATRPSLAVSTTRVNTETAEEATSDSSLWSAAPWQHRRQLQGDLDNIVLTALRTEPKYRYASVQLLNEDLERHLVGEPVRARKAGALYRFGKFARRNKWPLAAVATFIGLGVAFLAVTLRQNHSITQSRDQALAQEQRAEEVADFFVDLFAELNPRNTLGGEVNSRDILDKASDRLLGDSEGDPAVRARLLTNIGSIYYDFGDVEKSGEILELAYQEAQGLGGLDLARATRELALHRYFSGSSESFQLGLDAVALFEEFGSPAELAEMYSLISQWTPSQELALEFAEKGYALAQEVGDWRLIELALNHLSIETLKTDPERALEYLEAAVQLRRDRGRLANDPRFLRSLGNLAYQYQMRGQLQRAEELHREAVERTRAVLGPDAPDLGVRHNNLAQHLIMVGAYEEAQHHAEVAHEIWLKGFGDDSARLRHSLNKLCQAGNYLGEAVEAQTSCERALEITEKGPWSFLLASMDSARNYRFLGDFERAHQKLDTAWGILSEQAGDEVAGTWQAQRIALERGLTFHAAGQREAAAEQFSEVITLTGGALEDSDIYGIVWSLIAKLHTGQHDQLDAELSFSSSAGAKDREIELYCRGAGEPPVCAKVQVLFPDEPWTGPYPALPAS
ncbi:MAG: serine/threonine-protein kinase [Acidobacteriota bacterium]